MIGDIETPLGKRYWHVAFSETDTDRSWFYDVETHAAVSRRVVIVSAWSFHCRMGRPEVDLLDAQIEEVDRDHTC